MTARVKVPRLLGASLLLLVAGCPKKLEAVALDAGAPPVTIADADAGPGDAATDADDAALTPLTSAKPVAPAAPNPNAPGCADARKFCKFAGVTKDPAMVARCNETTKECVSHHGVVGGGH